MLKTNIKKSMALATLSVMATSILGASAARADYSCRDYYAAYVDEATEPTPTVVIVGINPNYHGHYPVYHSPQGGYNGPDLHNGGGQPPRNGGPNDNQGPSGNNNNKNNNNNNNNATDTAIAVGAVVVLGALSTTSTAMEDAELQDAENVIYDIDQAQMGDGAQLENLLSKVQADMPAGKTASLNQVSSELMIDNDTYQFCAGGDLDSEAQLASLLASQIASQE